MLEDEADPAILWPCPRDVLPVNQDRPAVGLLEPGDHPKQRGLARAARPEQSSERALRDFERDVVDRRKLLKALGHALDLDLHLASFLLGPSRVIASNTISDVTASSVAAA
jgi:hypothetical protein